MTAAAAAILCAASCRSRADRGLSNQRVAISRALLAEGRVESALGECRLALAADSKNPTANQLMGRLLIESGSLGRAEAYFERAARLPGEVWRMSEDEIAAAAESLLVLGKAHRAVQFLSEAAGIYPGCARLRLLRAIAHFKAKEFAASIVSLEESLNAGGAEEADRDVLREIFGAFLDDAIRDGRAADALARALRAVELFPDSARFQAFLARCLIEAGKTEEAGKAIEKALSLDPYSIEAVRQARLYYVMQKRYWDAREAWLRAMPRGLLDSQANKTSELLRSLGFLSKAAENLTGDFVTHFNLARCYRGLGWIDEAIEQCGHALTIKPGDGEAVRELAALLNHRDFLRAARTYIYEIYSQELQGRGVPDISDVAESLCKIARSQGIALTPEADNVYRIVFFGKEINTVNFQQSALARYFLKYGQYIEISQVHESVSCKVMNIAAWFQMKAEEASPFLTENCGQGIGRVHTDYSWVLCDEDSIMSFAGFASNGPRVSGRTSLSRKGFFVDLVPLRPPTGELRGALRALKGEGAESGWSSDRNALVGAVLAGVKPPEDEKAALDAVFQRLLTANVEAVAVHEEGHIVDMDRHLPVLLNIPSYFIEGFRTRLSPRRILNRIELYAEAYAAANSCSPHMVLLNNLLRIEYDRPAKYVFYLLYDLSLEGKQISPYTNAARRMYDFLSGRMKVGPPGGGRIGEALARLSREEAAALNKEFCRRNHVKW